MIEHPTPETPSQPVRLPLGTNRVWASWVLLGINILVYLATLVLSFIVLHFTGLPNTNIFNPVSGVLQLMGWKENVLIYQGQYWRFITAMFLHGGLLHILFNGFALYVLGPEAERIYGTGRFVALYFVSGIAGGVASYAFSPHPSVGASGAIFGLIGGLAVFFYTSRDILGEIGRRQLQNMLSIIVINILIGLSAGGVIDNFAHLGGLVGGAVSGRLLVPHYTVDRRFWPPQIERKVSPLGWAGVAGFCIGLVVLTLFITPPL
jgi:rhomboid protease GluP